MTKIFSEPQIYDVIVVGGQEAKMTQKTSIIIDFANYLGQFGFLTITSVVMWEMFLVGFVRMEHVPCLKNPQIAYIATGMGGVLGNKGGLQMSFKLHDYLFNFINVHLVHGAKRLDKRNEMMSDLIRKMRIQREELDPDFIADFSFILGDMNYRMEGAYDTLVPRLDEIVKLRKELDQLHKSMTELGRYPDYHEFDIEFKPTYKRIKVGEQGYFNKKNQAPSYTDRVLMKNNTTQSVLLNSYNSLEHVMGSDHKPVQLDIDVLLRPLQYVQMPALVNPALAHAQGLGVITFRKLTVRGLKQAAIEAYTRKKIVFPSHL